MGIKQSELIPVGVLGPTPITPAAKPDLSKFFQVTRTDIASVVKARLPANASVVVVTLYGSVASNALTTGTVTINITDNTGIISTGTVDVKTSGATTALVQMSNLPLLESNPPTGDISISAVYAETGAASTLGGPWKVRVIFA